MQPSPRLKAKTVEKWVRAVEPLLAPGESMWALVKATRMSPLTEALAITNGRLIAFTSLERESSKRIKLVAHGEDILSFEFRSKAGSVSLWVRTTNAETNFGTVHPDDVEFTRHYMNHLQSSGNAVSFKEFPAAAHEDRSVSYNAQGLPAASVDPAELSARGAIPVFGTPLTERWWTMLRNHAPDERPWLVISGIEWGLLAAFGDHLVIAKTEAIVATANSAIRMTVFPFAQITHVECEKAPAGGMIQVLRGPNDGPYTRAQKPRVIDPNCLPIPKNVFIQAAPSIDQLRLRIWETRPDAEATPRPPAAAQPPAPSAVQPASNFAIQSSTEIHPETREEPAPAVLATQARSGLAGELADLAELHQQGVIDDDEFRAAKLAAIKRHS
ncbi:SHOCT domain-containing protein [Prescottella equi]|uniref:SHOCT domain-containing protein n=1 Tax=Rhodococcus hoagii TaxID=43767 RepID=UPI00384E9882